MFTQQKKEERKALNKLTQEQLDFLAAASDVGADRFLEIDTKSPRIKCRLFIVRLGSRIIELNVDTLPTLLRVASK